MDRIDLKIIETLRENARFSNKEIGERVGLSASACSRRISSLEASGVIRGYTVVLTEEAPSARVPVFVHAKLENTSEAYMRRFEKAARECTEIQECYLVTGTYDYLFRVNIGTMGDFERLHTRVLSTLPSITGMVSSFTIRNAFTSHI